MSMGVLLPDGITWHHMPVDQASTFDRIPAYLSVSDVHMYVCTP